MICCGLLLQVILSVLEPSASACVLTEVATAGAASALPQNRGKPGDSPEHPHSLVLFVEPERHCQIENALDWTLKIQQQLTSTLSSHTVPDHVVIIGEIPVTSHGEHVIVCSIHISPLYSSFILLAEGWAVNGCTILEVVSSLPVQHTYIHSVSRSQSCTFYTMHTGHIVHLMSHCRKGGQSEIGAGLAEG